MQFSRFAPFGLFTFGVEASPAKTAYDALKGAVKGDPSSPGFDMTQGTYEEARVFATAMEIGCARNTLKRADNQRIPTRAVAKLPTLERDYPSIPGPLDTIQQRQARVAARKKLMRGAREEAIYTDLYALLGTSLIRIRATLSADRKTYPTVPSTVGTFPAIDTPPKFFTLIDPVAITGSPHTVRFAYMNSSVPPFAGELLTIEPECNAVAEAITVTALSSSQNPAVYPPDQLTATFTKAHTPGASIVTQSPQWRSTQRELQIIVTPTAAHDPETRRKIHEIMTRHCKTTTRWHIIETADNVTTGPWTVNVAVVGSTALGTAGFTF